MKNKRKTDFRNSNQNRKAVKTKRDNRSHTNFEKKTPRKIFEKGRKTDCRNSYKIRKSVKTERDGGYHTNFKR